VQHATKSSFLQRLTLIKVLKELQVFCEIQGFTSMPISHRHLHRPRSNEPSTKLNSFFFCWLCISIYLFKEKPTWCTIYLQYISSNTSTCFGRIYSSSLGGTTVWIQQLVLIVLFRWLSVVLAGLEPRAVWRNILKINCKSSWVFFKWTSR